MGPGPKGGLFYVNFLDIILKISKEARIGELLYLGDFVDIT